MLSGQLMLRFKKHFGIFAWSHPEFLRECPGEIMNGVKSKHEGDLADGILSFAYHLPAGFKLQFVDVFFRRLVHAFFE